MGNSAAQSKKIRKGDRVLALAGNDKGKIGVVRSLHGDRMVVEGLNLRKKHVKKTQEAPQGGIIEFEVPIHVSNLRICVEGDRAVKLKMRRDEEGGRHLVYEAEGQEFVYRSIKKPK